MRYRIKEHRLARGWSQDHLAALAGTSKGYISQLESGKRDPSAETLRSLSAALGIDATEMVEPDTEQAREVIEILAVFQKLSAEDRAVIFRVARSLLPPADDKPASE